MKKHQFVLLWQPNIEVEVRLSFHGTSLLCRFALDTGCTTTMATPDILELLGVDLEQPDRVVDTTTASKIEQTRQYIIDRIESLGHSRSPMRLSSHPLHSGHKVVGFLGLDFFRNHRLTIDFRESWIAVQ